MEIALSGRKRGDRMVRITPTKVEYEPLIKADDFGLKEAIKV